MLAKSRFLRFVLVAFFPLALLGGWLAETETLFPHHSFIECIEQPFYFSCASHTVTKAQMHEAMDDASVKFTINAILIDGFRHKVFPYELPKDSGILNKSTMKRGEEISLSLPIHGVRKNVLGRWTGSCEVNRAGEGMWEYSCGTAGLGFFEFSDARTESKFQQLHDEIIRLKEMDFRRYLAAKVASLISPFTALAMLVFLFFMLKRAVRFVTGTTPENS